MHVDQVGDGTNSAAQPQGLDFELRNTFVHNCACNGASRKRSHIYYRSCPTAVSLILHMQHQVSGPSWVVPNLQELFKIQ